MKFFSFVLFLLLISNISNVRAEEYKFITPQFQEAIRNINPDSFFKDVQDINLPASVAITDEQRMGIIRGNTSNHYEKIYTTICKELNSSYTEILKHDISGDQIDSFMLELTTVMKAQGAYILPVLHNHSLIAATYFNPGWNPNNKKVASGHEEFFEKYKTLRGQIQDDPVLYAFPDGGFIEAKGSMPKGAILGENRLIKSSYFSFLRFHDIALKQGGLELKDLSYEFYLAQPYLLILEGATNHGVEDKIYLYLQLPFRISGDSLKSPFALSSANTPKKCARSEINNCIDPYKGASEFKCELASISQALGYSRIDKFQAGQSILIGADFEPLTVPLNENYRAKQVEYSVSAAEIAEPSIKCWLQLVAKIGDGNIERCRSADYAEEFIAIRNLDICVGKDGVKSAIKASYPYNVSGGARRFKRNGFDESCSN